MGRVIPPQYSCPQLQHSCRFFTDANFPIDFVRRIITGAPKVQYVKEECTPGGQRITKLLPRPHSRTCSEGQAAGR